MGNINVSGCVSKYEFVELVTNVCIFYSNAEDGVGHTKSQYVFDSFLDTVPNLRYGDVRFALTLVNSFLMRHIAVKYANKICSTKLLLFCKFHLHPLALMLLVLLFFSFFFLFFFPCAATQGQRVRAAETQCMQNS